MSSICFQNTHASPDSACEGLDLRQEQDLTARSLVALPWQDRIRIIATHQLDTSEKPLLTDTCGGTSIHSPTTANISHLGLSSS